MADEAFALSPISARATQPSEADYDAIREAFMETSRGRWFLGEYAKRNRNADTRMVLDAVARIEETLAAQRKPVRDPMLDEALAALRNALGQAKGATRAALGHLALEENLAPVRKGARVIREIAWRLREIGADGRICDLIDSQVGAIEEAAARMAPADLAAALSGVFDLLEARIAVFEADDAQTPAPPKAEAARPEAFDEAASPAAGTAGTAPRPDAAVSGQAAAVEDVIEAAVAVEAEPSDAFDAADEAMLDRVALEMAAFDTDTAYEPAMDEMSGADMSDGEIPERQAPGAELSVAPASAAQASVAAKNAHVPVDDIEITFVTEAREPKAEPAMAAPGAAPIQVSPDAEHAPSLGSSLLANGIVQRPRTSKPDPLAPIRRMSQTEKIAFFS
jgi:hypothetical protein